MSIHQCPKCELRFSHRTELDDHIWHDHADFRHDYPASAPPPVIETEAPVAAVVDSQGRSRHRGSLVGWLTPKESRDHDREHTLVAPGQAEYTEVEEEERDAAGPAVD